MTDKTEINKKKRAFKDTLKQRQPVAHNIPAVMGDGQGNLRLDNGRVWVLINGVAYKALCTRVAPKYGKQVWVGVSYDGGKRGKVYQVLSDNITKATDPSIIQSGGYAPAENYEWGGPDPIHVNLRSFTFLRLTEAGGMNVYLDEGKIHNGTDFIAVPGQDIDVSAHIPATAGKAALVLISVDVNGDVVQTKGAETDIANIVLPSPLPDVLPHLPAVPAGTVFVCGAVRVYEGQTEVREGQTETDITDLRFVWRQPGGSGGVGDISGTGVVGQVAEFVMNTKTLQAAKLIGPATHILTITNTAAVTLGIAVSSGKTLTLTATDDFNLTIPATGTAALLGTVNQFTANQVITATLSTPASTAYGLDLEITHAADATNVSAGQRGLFLTTTLTGSGGATAGYAGAVINALSSNTGTIATLFGTSSLARSNATSGNVTLAVAVRGQIATLDNGTMTEGDAFAAVSPTKVGAITTTVGYHAYNQGLAGATTSYAVLIEAQSGSTTNYAIYANAGLNYFAGNTGIGVTGPTATDVLSVTGTITASTGTLSGVFIYPNYWPSANSSATQYGVRCIAQGNGIKSMTNLYGGEFRAVNNISAANGLVVGGYFLVVNNSASTITTANAGSFGMTSVNASSVITTGNMVKINSPTMTAGSVTTMNGLLIQNMGATGITNAYGIYIDAQSGAATLNYAIYTNAGDIVFNGAGAAQADFTWKTDTYDGIFGDSSNDSIVIMSNAAGKIGFWGHAAAAQPAAYTLTNVTERRTLDADSYNIDDVVDLVCTLATDLQSYGGVG